MNRPSVLSCSLIVMCLPLWCGCSSDSIDSLPPATESSVDGEDFHRTLIGQAEQDVIKLLGEPDNMEAVEVEVLVDATDEEMQRWSDEMKRTVTLTYMYESRDLAVLFNIDQEVIATRPLNQEYPQTGSRID